MARPTSTGRPGAPAGAPLVAVVMGSSSDLAVMQGAAEVLERFGIAHEVRVVSAHRTPDDMLAFGHAAAGPGPPGDHRRGRRRRPPARACWPRSPPCRSSASRWPWPTLDGLDSLLSIVQMPRGVPVATVAVNGAANAGLLAVRILAAVATPRLAEAMAEYQRELAEQARPRTPGWYARLTRPPAAGRHGSAPGATVMACPRWPSGSGTRPTPGC